MNEAIAKSLSDLIDETLQEIEELRKSSKTSPEELELKGPGESLNSENAGEEKDVNGGGAGLKKEEDEKEDEEEESEEEEKEEKEEDGEEKKEEPKKAMPFEGKETPAEEKAEKKEMAKEEDKKEDKKEESKDEYFKLFKKSEDEVASLKKSVDERLAPMEEKLTSLFDMVTKLANSPAPAKGLTARSIVPLQKSEDAPAPLSKEQVSDKLFDLKKTGVSVPAEDFVKIDLGGDLAEIVKKYNLK